MQIAVSSHDTITEAAHFVIPYFLFKIPYTLLTFFIIVVRENFY